MMDDDRLMRSLKAVFLVGDFDAGRDWAELAERSKRMAEYQAVRRGRRRVVAAAAGVALIVGLAAFWSIGGAANTSRLRGDLVADPNAIRSEQLALQVTLADLQRQAAVQQAVIKLTEAQARTARLQRDLDALSKDDSEVESMLAEARAASWMWADAERRAKGDQVHEQWEARRLYEQLVRVYPGTPAAERALARLARQSLGPQ